MALFNKINESNIFNILKEKTRNIRDIDIEDLLKKEYQVKDKILTNSGLKEYLTQVKQMFALVKAYWQGEYREIPRYTIAAIAATLLYVLMPLDLLPDFIPGVGLIDDALMIILCLRWIKNDLQAFEEWRFKNAKWINRQ